MNRLLDVAGAFLYPVVMFIISPLLLLVWTGIGVCIFIGFIGAHQPNFSFGRVDWLRAPAAYGKGAVHLLKAKHFSFLKFPKDVLFRGVGLLGLSKGHGQSE